MSRDGVVVGETIAEAALADDRNSENPLLAPYREGGERSDNPYVNFSGIIAPRENRLICRCPILLLKKRRS